MRVCIPNFYRKFKCLADKCNDTCCSGWEIDLDPETLALYKNVKGPLGAKLEASIEKDHFKLLDSERCPFLDKNNLCEIYKHLGGNALSSICKAHPRFKEWYGDYMEIGLGLCCEESIQLLLNEDSLQFSLTENSEEVTPLDNESLAFRDKIFHHRNELFIILKDRSKSLKTRLYHAFFQEEIFQREILPEYSEPKGKDITSPKNILSHYTEILFSTESLGESWERVLTQILKKPLNLPLSETPFFSPEESEKIIMYLLFRYYSKSFFDRYSMEKFKFSIFFMIILQSYGKELAYSSVGSEKVNAIKILSKQLEYSEDNMNFLFNAFNKDSFFSIPSFNLLIEKLF